MRQEWREGGTVRYGSWFGEDELDLGIKEVRATTRSTTGVFFGPKKERPLATTSIDRKRGGWTYHLLCKVLL